MEILSDNNLSSYAFVASQRRSSDVVKPSKKITTPDGRQLYWLPLLVVNSETGRRVDISAFSVSPVPVREFDLLEVDGVHLLNVFAGREGAQPVGMYYFDHVEVVGNMLDAMRQLGGGVSDDAAAEL